MHEDHEYEGGNFGIIVDPLSVARPEGPAIEVFVLEGDRWQSIAKSYMGHAVKQTFQLSFGSDADRLHFFLHGLPGNHNNCHLNSSMSTRMPSSIFGTASEQATSRTWSP